MVLGRREVLAYGIAAVPLLAAVPKMPRFPARDFSIEMYGAVASDNIDSLPAVRKAIEACHASGGGRVIVPPGDYVMNGPIHLRSNIDLHIAEGAHIRFGTTPDDYLPTVQVLWEGIRCFSHSPLVYASGERNVAISGAGILDGRADAFWSNWASLQGPDQTELRRMGEDKADVGKRQFGAGHFLRPQLVHFYNCHDVLIEGVTLQKSPFWTVHLAYCTKATIRGIHVLPGVFALPGSNDDAIDIECCSNVIVEDSLLESYDDSVAIKAGRGRDAWGGPACSNVIVRRCTARTRTDGFMIGSEMSGGVRNVLVEDCRVEQARSALAFRSNTDRGGFVENVAFRRIAITNCGVAIRVASDFQNIVDHPYPPRYRNFRFSEITCTNASERGIHIVGLPRHDVRGIRLEDVEIKTSAMPSKIEEVRNLRMRAVRVNGVLAGSFDH